MKAAQTRRDNVGVSRRAMCVTTRGVQLAIQTLAQAQATHFAQAITRRYQGWRIHWPSLSFVFSQRRETVTMHAVSHVTQVHVAPRLALTVLPQPLGSARPMVQHVIQQVEQRFVSMLHASTPTQRLVSHLLSRGARIEGGAGAVSHPRLEAETAVDSTANTPQWVPPVPPVPRIVHRPAPTATVAAAPTPTVAASATVNGWERAQTGYASQMRSAGAMPPEANAIDVNRLTDQVIRAIDRRIIAQRERLGRI